MPRKPAEEALKQLTKKFWANVKKTPCCWLWTGPTKRSGGGPQVHIPEDTLHGPCYVPAHYLSWYLKYGGWPRPKSIERHCDELLCVRPSHYHRKPRPLRNRSKKIPAGSEASRALGAAASLAAVAPSTEGATPSLLFAVARELRDHVAEHRQAARLILSRLEALARELKQLRGSMERLEQGADVGEPPDYAPQLCRIEEGLAGLLPDATPEPVQHPRPPEHPQPLDPEPEPTPSLSAVLRDAFAECVGGPPPDSEDSAELERAFDVALRECDGDTAAASATFRRWLAWFALSVADSPNGRGPEPTHGAFYRAVSSDAPDRPGPVERPRAEHPEGTEPGAA